MTDEPPCPISLREKRQLAPPEPACSAAACACDGAIGLPLGPAMLAGAGIGSYRGAHDASRIGNVSIERIFDGIVLVMVKAADGCMKEELRSGSVRLLAGKRVS